ncbi:MAG: helix-hairpin-helix domain-containing protein, partial [Gemmatimonadota bacterium]|nr:helix-hairpin-helix domain-containing protein [Gemmatimonadota bacterium]
LSSAREALIAIALEHQTVISLAKREEEIFMPGRSESVRLPRRSPALRMLQQARDEAHRFAITFQRKKRAARTLTSELLKIPGVGPNKRRALLSRFGSVQGVRDAALAEIAGVTGFSLIAARKIHLALGVSVPPNLATGDATSAADSAIASSGANETVNNTVSDTSQHSAQDADSTRPGLPPTPIDS